ncbi:hypothetical protein LGH82_33155 [Mesorhizobium sp. PAMC28654]|uniref:hypothetical protein n=1 Tax=Mesorhizobium sp. PAMC28654 TaxID=2880934 RepID=UPI001D0A3727|nr:hypothetical protein [Mesorhizobium sp. PAMC28654]UDL89830.1 hypothetical protein LGH82_33155 [Mesorhizobium sp. PAMC28654]
MREALMIIPKADNHGHDLSNVRKATLTRMIDAFGGCTVRDAEGYWLDNGKLYQEPVTELVSAYTPTDFNDATLREIATQAGHDAKQLAVYVRFASGEVELINTAPAYANAA